MGGPPFGASRPFYNGKGDCLMEDFVFGTLASDALRLAHARQAARRRLRTILCPIPYASEARPTRAVELTAWARASLRPQAWVYWSADEQDPQGCWWTLPVTVRRSQWTRSNRTGMWWNGATCSIIAPSYPASPRGRWCATFSCQRAGWP